MDWSVVTNNLIFLIATWLIFVITAIGLGRRVIELIKRSDELDSLERIATLFVGYGLLSFTSYALAALHLLYPSVVIGLGLISLLIGFIPGLTTTRALLSTSWQTIRTLLTPQQVYPERRRGVGWFTTLATVATGATVLFSLAQVFPGVIAPDRSFDAIWYHLTEAKLYLQEHRLLFWLPPSQFAQSPVAPRLMEFLSSFTLPFSPLGDWARFAHGSLVAVALAASYRAGCQLGRRPLAGVVALLGTALLPITFWLITTTYVDLATLAGSALLIAALVDAFGTDGSSQLSRSRFWLIGLVGGLLLATKLWNLIVLPSLLLFFALLSTDRRPSWRTVLSLLGLMLLVDSPYPIEALIRTGNPIYPILAPGLADPDHLRGALSIREYLTRVLPETTLATWAHLFVYESLLWIGGVLNLFQLLIGHLERRVWPFLAFAGALFLLWSLIPVADVRYALVAVPGLAVIGASAIATTLELPSLLALVTVAVLSSGSINLVQAIRQEASQYLARPVSAAERTAFIERTLGRDRWIVVDPRGELQARTLGERILVLGHNLFYLDVPFTDAYGIASQGVLTSEPHTSAALLDRLIAEGYHFLLVKDSVYQVKDLFAGLDQPTDDWLNQHVRAIWNDELTRETLYALTP